MMPGAFIAAIGVLVITLAIAFLCLFAKGMSSAPSTRPSGAWTVIRWGVLIAALFAVTHYLPEW